MPKLNWKLLTKKRGSSTGRLPAGLVSPNDEVASLAFGGRMALRAGALFLRPRFLSAVLVPSQNGELALFVLRELELGGPRLGKEFRIRLRKYGKRTAIVKLD